MMDAVQSQHLGRVRQLREAFAEANERLVARLRGASDERGGARAGRRSGRRRRSAGTSRPSRRGLRA